MTEFVALAGVCFALVVGVAIGFVFGLLVSKTNVRARQNTGEAAVANALSGLASNPAYHLMNNVTLPYLDGTTQIDHVLVSRYGIFVIETKHYTGWIFGDARSPQWTQVVYKKKSKFQNPTHQNAKHVRAVRALLPFIPPEQVQSLVVFTGDAQFKTEMPRTVIKLRDLLTRIHAFAAEAIALDQMQLCIGTVEHARLAITRQTDVEHQAYVQGKYRRAI